MYRGKRVLAFVLGFVFLFGACGKAQDGPEFPETIEVTMECPIATIAPDANRVVTLESEMTMAPTREVLPEVIATEVPKEPTLTPEPTETPMPTAAPMPIPATVGPDGVLVDNEELTLLVTGDVYEETGGYVIGFFLENHTNKSVRYEIDELALNGFLCEPFYELKCDLYPETGTYGAIEYFSYWKDETEGDTVTEISFSLSATSLDYDYWYSEDFTVYLRGEEAVQEYVYVPEDRDVVLYDGPEALLAMTDIELSEEDGKMICTATAYVENKTGETLYTKCENAEEIVARAGEYLPDEWNDYVIAGKKRKVQLVLYDCLESWEEKGKWFVTLPLEMSLSVDGSYKTDTFFDETITLLISGEEIGIASDD